MKLILAVGFTALLAACGVETAGSAATAAAIKKQELEQGKKTMSDAQQKIDAALRAQQQRAAAAPAEQ